MTDCSTVKATKAGIRARLKFTGYNTGQILLDTTAIGRFEQYAKEGKSGRHLVLGSRIYRGEVVIEVEAGRINALLDKVAEQLAKAINAGTWNRTDGKIS